MSEDGATAAEIETAVAHARAAKLAYNNYLERLRAGG